MVEAWGLVKEPKHINLEEYMQQQNLESTEKYEYFSGMGFIYMQIRFPFIRFSYKWFLLVAIMMCFPLPFISHSTYASCHFIRSWGLSVYHFLNVVTFHQECQWLICMSLCCFSTIQAFGCR
ncbi:hypothetical protein AMTRI_Chr01g113540 [Amborella trichopoda]